MTTYAIALTSCQFYDCFARVDQDFRRAFGPNFQTTFMLPFAMYIHEFLAVQSILIPHKVSSRNRRLWHLTHTLTVTHAVSLSLTQFLTVHSRALGTVFRFLYDVIFERTDY